jgi:hypothetical protein
MFSEAITVLFNPFSNFENCVWIDQTNSDFNRSNQNS